MKPFLDQDFLLSTETAKKLYHEVAEQMPISTITAISIRRKLLRIGNLITFLRSGSAATTINGA